MKFGFIVPNNWGLEDPQQVIEVALRAEELGYDSVWVNHHVLHVGFVLDRLGSKPYYDPLTTLTYIAALTKKVRLGTSVLVLPYLHPMVLAKALATLDVMSGGRLTVGIGAGGLRPESDALGSSFSTRGAYTDESVAIMKVLWTEEQPSFEGRFYRFSGVKFSPKPFQKPYPPIWVGGQSRAAMHRVARLADGWHPVGLSPEELSKRLPYLEAQVGAAGRRMAEIALSVRLELGVLTSARPRQEGPMIGNPDQLLGTIEGYTQAGVREMIFAVSTSDPHRIFSTLESFANKVMPRARG